VIVVEIEIIDIALDLVVGSRQSMCSCEQLLLETQETSACEDLIRLVVCYLDQVVLALLLLSRFVPLL
jgi:hypothetical protein